MASGHQSRPASAAVVVDGRRRRRRRRRRSSSASSTATRRPAEAVGDRRRPARRSGVTGVGGSDGSRADSAWPVQRGTSTAAQAPVGRGRPLPVGEAGPGQVPVGRRRRRRPPRPRVASGRRHPSSGPRRSATRGGGLGRWPGRRRSDARVRRARTSSTVMAISSADGPHRLDAQVGEAGDQGLEQLGAPVGQGQHGRGLDRRGGRPAWRRRPSSRPGSAAAPGRRAAPARAPARRRRPEAPAQPERLASTGRGRRRRAGRRRRRRCPRPCVR